jgi:hypothetical protein
MAEENPPFSANEEIKNVLIYFYVLSRILVTIDGVWIGSLDLLEPCTINSYLQAIQRYH